MAGTISDSKTRSLYDDWKARRERLAFEPGGEADYRAVELRLLDFLLMRYRDAPEANRPAMFPMSKGTFINHRAIVVHHHLGGGTAPKISNRWDAQNRVRTMIEHLWSPLSESEAAAMEDEPARFAAPSAIDPVEAVREKLCDADPAIRIRSALSLGELGGLDDIGLMSDLLSLPHSSDEHPKEREAILHAMRQLSGEAVGEFDCSDFQPLPVNPANADNPANEKHFTPLVVSPQFFSLLVLSALFVSIGVIILALAYLEAFRR